MDLPVLPTRRLLLAIPSESDATALLSYAQRNHEHLKPWSPPAPPGWDTLDNAVRRARLYQDQARAGTCYRFWARLREQPASDFIGAVTLSQIVLGARRACSLGYHVDVSAEGRGYVTEAARAVIDFAFRRLLLHRVEATYVPENERSARVLARLGLEREGYAKEYLFVGGRFRDHVLTALVNTDLQGVEALCTPSS
jgi:ribosomal-protein-alanine N-acetyltransferase